jgi:hypothetical protein
MRGWYVVEIVHLGRELEAGEIVHHRDGDRTNSITWCSSTWNVGGLEGFKRCSQMTRFLNGLNYNFLALCRKITSFWFLLQGCLSPRPLYLLCLLNLQGPAV